MFLLPQEAVGLAHQATWAGLTSRSVGQAGQELWQHDEWRVTVWSYLTFASLTTPAVLMLLTLLAAKLYDRFTMHRWGNVSLSPCPVS